MPYNGATREHFNWSEFNEICKNTHAWIFKKNYNFLKKKQTGVYIFIFVAFLDPHLLTFLNLHLRLWWKDLSKDMENEKEKLKKRERRKKGGGKEGRSCKGY
jgi:hypothetical protein